MLLTAAFAFMSIAKLCLVQRTLAHHSTYVSYSELCSCRIPGCEIPTVKLTRTWMDLCGETLGRRRLQGGAIQRQAASSPLSLSAGSSVPGWPSISGISFGIGQPGLPYRLAFAVR